jgi:NADH-quinone oxidoreductase subunit J
MDAAFYISSAVAVASTAMVVTRTNAVHALLYLIVSLLAVAVVFYALGAPFVAALEVIIYAGAVMVLFVFVIMMLNLGPHAARQERAWIAPRAWIGPAVLSLVLLGELIYIIAFSNMPAATGVSVSPKETGIALFGPYVAGVELASMLLLAALVGAYHLGRREEGRPGEGGHG